MDSIIQKLSGVSVSESEAPPPPPPVFPTFDLPGVATYIKEKQPKNIVVMSGAGISVAAGIPDFRTPGTGLYSQLEKYQLPYPEAIFTLDYFKTKPQPFFTLAKEMWPGNYAPTSAHFFVKLLEQKGMLLRNFTQNIDGLERVAGVTPTKMVEAHGTFAQGHCIKCRKEFSNEWMEKIVVGSGGGTTSNIPICDGCGDGVVKPDIVFFGEQLPARFHVCVESDLPKCDLLIVIGTSLTVFPFAALVDLVGSEVPRVLINREVVGNFEKCVQKKYRDVALCGDLQENVRELTNALGWGAELKELETQWKGGKGGSKEAEVVSKV